MLRDDNEHDADVLIAVSEAEYTWPDVVFAAMREGKAYRLLAARQGRYAERVFPESVLQRADAQVCLWRYCKALAKSVGA